MEEETMEMKLVTRGIEATAWLEEFARTTVAFSLWHHRVAVERVWIHLDTGGAPHAGFARCGIAAETELGPISAGATGSGPHEALAEAARLLEVALFERAERERERSAATTQAAA
jgi:hypothetical protein